MNFSLVYEKLLFYFEGSSPVSTEMKILFIEFLKGGLINHTSSTLLWIISVVTSKNAFFAKLCLYESGRLGLTNEAIE